MTHFLTLILLLALTIILRNLCKKKFTKVVVSIAGMVILAISSSVSAIQTLNNWRVAATFGILFLMFVTVFIYEVAQYSKLLREEIQKKGKNEEKPQDVEAQTEFVPEDLPDF